MDVGVYVTVEVAVTVGVVIVVVGVDTFNVNVNAGGETIIVDVTVIGVAAVTQYRVLVQSTDWK